jgi:hypothetical protein
VVSLYWLPYHVSGGPVGVVIIEAPDPLQARFRAAVEGFDQGNDATECHKLEPDFAALIPRNMIGRRLMWLRPRSCSAFSIDPTHSRSARQRRRSVDGKAESHVRAHSDRDTLASGARNRYSGPPMTLGNMRANGVRTLDAWCSARGCNHHSVVDVSALADEVPVPSIGPRPRCASCGHLGADARPNWSEYQAPGMGRHDLH